MDQLDIVALDTHLDTLVFVVFVVETRLDIVVPHNHLDIVVVA